MQTLAFHAQTSKSIHLMTRRTMSLKISLANLMMVRCCLFICFVTAIVSAQTNCSCSPLQYKMQLNLLSTCPPSNITTGPSSGIDRLECFVTSADSDMVPVTVTSYVIAELDQNLQPVRVKNVHNVTLFTGDNVTFMSTTHSEPAFVSGGLQVSINGINAGSQIVTLQFLVEFTNLCNTPPFSDGDSVGWLTILRGTPTRPNTCYSNQPTSSPSSTRKSSKSPTFSSTIPPSLRLSSKKRKSGKNGDVNAASNGGFKVKKSKKAKIHSQKPI